MNKSKKISIHPLALLAVIELWLAFLTYDYAISDEINFISSAAFSAFFVYFNNKSGQGFFGPQVQFQTQSVLIVTLFISLGGSLFGWSPVELFFRLIIAYGATVGLQKARHLIIARYNLDDGAPRPVIIEHS
ncbi:MAG: hypothetical protein AB8C84_11190 [Oligoflexales bacterium]